MILIIVGWVDESLCKVVFEDKNVWYFWLMDVLCVDFVFFLFFNILFKNFWCIFGLVKYIFYIVFCKLLGKGWFI